MKSIQKLKKLGKITAGSALLVGATLTGAAGLASAANHNTDLGDYPTPFVGEDGQVQSTVVVGESAKTVDVVGAINIAGSLGQDAYETTEKTVSGSGGSWSTDSGVTLDTRNDDLYFGQNINNVRDTLTGSDLSDLGDAEFRDDGGTTYDITQNLNVGSLAVQFDNNADEFGSSDDPALHLELPAEGNVDTGSYVLNLQASIDTITVTESDVAGEDITLFGKEYTIASDHENANSPGYLKLYGSQEEMDVATGESTTVTINGNEHTLEVVSTDASATPSTSSLRVDGDLRQESLGNTFDVDGQEVRVDEVINTGATDDGNGIVQFAIGSEELHIMPDGQIEDEDDDDIDGLYSKINDGSWTEGDGISSINFYVGSEDDNEDALMAGETFSHSSFDQFELQFGGLNPDAGQGPSDTVGEVKVSPKGDDTVKADFSAGGDSATAEFLHETSTGDTTTDLALADDDGDNIVAVEGNTVQEDEYVTTDAGDFSHLWEVTSVDVDTADLTKNGATGDEATVTLKDAASGNSVDLDLDADGDGGNPDDDDVYEGTEVIDGQTYHATLDTKGNTDSSTYDLTLTWGTSAGFGSTGSGSSGVTTAFPTIETDSGARVSFYDPSQDPTDFGTALVGFNTNEQFINAGSAQGTEGSNGYGDGDDIVRDLDSDGFYTGKSSDTQLKGITLSSAGAGTPVTATNPWTGDDANDIDAVMFKDDGDSTWQSTDTIVTDDDEDDEYTGGADTLVAATTAQGSVGNGGASSNVATVSEGDSLNAFASADGVYWNDTTTTGTVDGDDDIWLESGSSTAGTYNSGDTMILDLGATATAGTTTGSQVTSPSVLTFVDDGTTGGSFEAGDDIYEEENSGTLTYSGGPDTLLAGSAPSITTSLTSPNPFTTAPQVAFYDASTAGTWESGSDLILTDGHNGGTVSTGADTVIVDGSPTETDGDSLTAFASSTKHTDGGTSTGQFDSTENIVDDSGTVADEYDSGDTVITGSLTGGNGVRFWSSDVEETNAVSGLQNILPSKPGFVFIEEESDADVQESYTVSASWSSSDDRLEMDSPTFSDMSKRSTKQLESDDDLTAGYDVWGAHTVFDSNEEGSFTLHYPDGQSTVGAAVTGQDGELSAEGGSGSVSVNSPTGFPDSAALDSDSNVDSAKESSNMILVGGPSVNALTQELANDNKTWTADQYSEGEGLVQLVNNAFTEGQDALVVAGYSGADTRQASNYIANYADHSDDLSGQDQVTVSTQ